ESVSNASVKRALQWIDDGPRPPLAHRAPFTLATERAMPYTLWSHGRLVGHTELDIPCVQSHIMQGFIEPTELGRGLLADAAGVPAVCAELERARKKAGAAHDEEAGLETFQRACDRREALHLELRDEDGTNVEIEWIQVNDIQSDPFAGIDDDDDEELD